MTRRPARAGVGTVSVSPSLYFPKWELMNRLDDLSSGHVFRAISLVLASGHGITVFLEMKVDKSSRWRVTSVIELGHRSRLSICPCSKSKVDKSSSWPVIQHYGITRSYHYLPITYMFESAYKLLRKQQPFPMSMPDLCMESLSCWQTILTTRHRAILRDSELYLILSLPLFESAY